MPLQNSKIRANFGGRAFAYAEGQAHRNAADLCVDLAEEISANFEALPFAMASDSDNDAGASVTSDSGSHGPPCRIAAVAVTQQRRCFSNIFSTYINIHNFTPLTFIKDSHAWKKVVICVCYCLLNLFFLLLNDTEYNSDLSCHYKVELSYDNLVTTGPNPHPPSIADDESDDEDDDDVPRVSRSSTFHILN